VIWGTTWSVIQIGLQGIPPFTGVAIRFAIAGLLLLGIARARGIRLGQTRRERRLWWGNGLLGFAVAYGVVYWAEQWVPSGLAAVLFAIYPLVVAILAHFFLKSEKLHRREVVGILLGFSGVGLIFLEDFTALGGPQVAVGAAVLLLSPLASGAATVSVKRWGHGIHPFSIAAVPMLVAAGTMAILALILERGASITWDRTSVLALLYLSIVGSALTFSVYFWLLSHLPAKRLAFLAYVIPIVAVGIGVLRGETFTPQVLVGSAVVVLGVALASRSRRQTSVCPPSGSRGQTSVCPPSD
jgi:drug/metabolite transporter (DMT)-like permease